jgi:nicotinamidase-related amidase
MDIETVLVTGVVTNFCVHSTAREAADYGFQVVIVEDCCAAWSPEFHEGILKSFGMLYGYILTHKKLMKKISRMMKKVKKEVAIH